MPIRAKTVTLRWRAVPKYLSKAFIKRRDNSAAVNLRHCVIAGRVKYRLNQIGYFCIDAHGISTWFWMNEWKTTGEFHIVGAGTRKILSGNQRKV